MCAGVRRRSPRSRRPGVTGAVHASAAPRRAAAATLPGAPAGWAGQLQLHHARRNPSNSGYPLPPPRPSPRRLCIEGDAAYTHPTPPLGLLAPRDDDPPRNGRRAPSDAGPERRGPRATRAPRDDDPRRRPPAHILRSSLLAAHGPRCTLAKDVAGRRRRAAGLTARAPLNGPHLAAAALAGAGPAEKCDGRDPQRKPPGRRGLLGGGACWEAGRGPSSAQRWPGPRPVSPLGTAPGAPKRARKERKVPAALPARGAAAGREPWRLRRGPG